MNVVDKTCLFATVAHRAVNQKRKYKPTPAELSEETYILAQILNW